MHLWLNGLGGDVQPATNRGSSNTSPVLCSQQSYEICSFYISQSFSGYILPFSFTAVPIRAYIWKRKGLIGLFHGSKLAALFLYQKYSHTYFILP